MGIKKDLLKMKDEKYLAFHSKLCKNVNLIGIRVPVLRKYATELYLENRNNLDYLLNVIDSEYYEEIMLKGMLIGIDKKVSLDVFFERIKKFVPLIDNWAVCDTFCAGLKLTKKYPNEVFDFLLPYFQSEEEFFVRFAIVMFLDYYINSQYLFKFFSLLEEVKNHDYYVEMAISWSLSVCLIHYYDETIKFLVSSKVSDFVYQKTIQKALESYRINNIKKEQLRLLKNKKSLLA